MLYAQNDVIGQVMNSMTQSTGSTFITLLVITFIVILIAIRMRFPIEYSVILVLPIHIGILAYSQQWFAVCGAFIIYLGVLLAKNWISE